MFNLIYYYYYQINLTGTSAIHAKVKQTHLKESYHKMTNNLLNTSLAFTKHNPRRFPMSSVTKSLQK